jgi:hypothetical protein
MGASMNEKDTNSSLPIEKDKSWASDYDQQGLDVDGGSIEVRYMETLPVCRGVGTATATGHKRMM